MSVKGAKGKKVVCHQSETEEASGEAEVVLSNKGGPKVIHNGYMYTLHKKQPYNIRWRCVRRSFYCRGSLVTTVDCKKPVLHMEHNHKPDYAAAQLARRRYAALGKPPIHEIVEEYCSNIQVKKSEPLEFVSVSETFNAAQDKSATTNPVMHAQQREKAALSAKSVRVPSQSFMKQMRNVSSANVSQGSPNQQGQQQPKTLVLKTIPLKVKQVAPTTIKMPPRQSSQGVSQNTIPQQAAEVILIIGLSGGCKAEEIVAITVKDVRTLEDVMIITINNSKTETKRTFIIEGEFFKIVRQYQDLRPANTFTDHFFIKYRNGKCIGQNIGINMIRALPNKIAHFLKLPDPESYTGHSFRKSSATLWAYSSAAVPNTKPNPWKYITEKNVESRTTGQQISTGISFSNQDPKISEANNQQAANISARINPGPSISQPDNQQANQSLKHFIVSDTQSAKQVCLRWNSYHSNMQNSFPSLLDAEQFVDVTLACEGRSLKCHKMILSSCSDYLAELLRENPCQHPIILMKDLKFWEVEALVKFMYRGEVNVAHEKLPQLLNAAEALQIKGLAGPSSQNSRPPLLIPQAKLQTQQVYMRVPETKENKPSTSGSATTPSSPKRGQKRQMTESSESRSFTKIRLQRPNSPASPNTAVKLEPLDIPMSPTEMFSDNNLMGLHEEDDPGGSIRDSEDRVMNFSSIDGPPDLTDGEDQMEFVPTDFLEQEQDIVEDVEPGPCLNEGEGSVKSENSDDCYDIQEFTTKEHFEETDKSPTEKSIGSKKDKVS